MKTIYKGLFITIIFMLSNSPLFLSEVYAKAFQKPQTIINLTENNVTVIDENAHLLINNLKDEFIFTDENGITYMTLDCIKDILNENIFYRYAYDGKSIDVFKNSNEIETVYFQIDLADLAIKYQNKDIALKEGVILKNNRIYLPLRNMLNILGYSNDEILYNSAAKTITLNKKPIFETDVITLTDGCHYKDEARFNITDNSSIETLVAALNKSPFYQADVTFKCGSVYTLDFNNGTVLKVISGNDITVCKIGVTGRAENTYQVPFNASIAIETFIRQNIDHETIEYDKWQYDLSNEEDLRSKGYIVCDYLDNDYSNLINYIEAEIENFSSKYTYSVTHDNKGIKVIIEYNGETVPINVYGYQGARLPDVDAKIRILKNMV